MTARREQPQFEWNNLTPRESYLIGVLLGLAEKHDKKAKACRCPGHRFAEWINTHHDVLYREEEKAPCARRNAEGHQ